MFDSLCMGVCPISPGHAALSLIEIDPDQLSTPPEGVFHQVQRLPEGIRKDDACAPPRVAPDAPWGLHIDPSKGSGENNEDRDDGCGSQERIGAHDDLH